MSNKQIDIEKFITLMCVGQEFINQFESIGFLNKIFPSNCLYHLKKGIEQFSEAINKVFGSIDQRGAAPEVLAFYDLHNELFSELDKLTLEQKRGIVEHIKSLNTSKHEENTND